MIWCDARSDTKQNDSSPETDRRPSMRIRAARKTVVEAYAVVVVLLAVALALSTGAVASELAPASFPSKPLRLIVPYPPGGGSDIMGRAIAERLSQQLRQQIIVDNRGGASTAIGAELASRAPADGYTLLVGTITTLAVNPNLRARLPYDPSRSFDPVTLLASQPYYVVLNPSVPARSIQELVAYVRARPGALNFGSPGVGSGSHLTGELFNSMAQTKLVHIGYKGAGPALLDLVAGHTSLMFATLSTVHSMVNSGKVVPIAITTAKRSQAMPDMPTIAESGIPGFSMRSWNGLLGPRGIPDAVLQRLNTETVSALQSPEFIKRMVAIGFEPDPTTPAEFAQFIKDEIALHARIIKSAGLKVE
jgi:tripartite-type tricarboxylate transporter receptor subunit TctC